MRYVVWEEEWHEEDDPSLPAVGDLIQQELREMLYSIRMRVVGFVISVEDTEEGITIALDSDPDEAPGIWIVERWCKGRLSDDPTDPDAVPLLFPGRKEVYARTENIYNLLKPTEGEDR